MNTKRESKIGAVLGWSERACPTCGAKHPVLSGQGFSEVRKELGISMREVARRAGISAAYLGDIEHGARELKLELADRLLKEVGI